jgi:alanyl-tRNA synthetase
LEEGGDVLHVLDGPLAADDVRGQVDGERRLDHRQQHHGQHLFSRALQDLFGARTVSFHLGAETTSIDLDRILDLAQVRAAELRTNEVIREARPVRVKTLSRTETLALGLSPPDDAGDAVRLVEAEGFDLQPCGGTHPRNTAEVGSLVVTGLERYKGGTRVHFLCGQRALAAFRDQGEMVARLGALLSAPPSGLVEAVERLLRAGQEARRASEALRERALRLEAERLLARALADRVRAAPAVANAPTVVVARLDDRSADELQDLAQAVVAAERCIALLGSGGAKAHLVFAQTPGLGFDAPALLKDSVALLGGRGGGRGDLARGGGDLVDRLDEALERARHAIEGGRTALASSAEPAPTRSR